MNPLSFVDGVKKCALHLSLLPCNGSINDCEHACSCWISLLHFNVSIHACEHADSCWILLPGSDCVFVFFTKCHVPLLAGLKLILVVVKLAT